MLINNSRHNAKEITNKRMCFYNYITSCLFNEIERCRYDLISLKFEILKHIVNTIFSTSKFPVAWKRAVVRPVSKVYKVTVFFLSNCSGGERYKLNPCFNVSLRFIHSFRKFDHISHVTNTIFGSIRCWNISISAHLYSFVNHHISMTI